jgi:hypothetical protein
MHTGRVERFAGLRDFAGDAFREIVLTERPLAPGAQDEEVLGSDVRELAADPLDDRQLALVHDQQTGTGLVENARQRFSPQPRIHPEERQPGGSGSRRC